MRAEQWELTRKHFPEAHFPTIVRAASRSQRAKCSRGGTVDFEYRRSVAHASSVLPELQDSAPSLSTVVPENDVIRAALTDLANVLRDKGEVDESECYIDATLDPRRVAARR